MVLLDDQQEPAHGHSPQVLLSSPQAYGEGLLVDTGAVNNMMGSSWLSRYMKTHEHRGRHYGNVEAQDIIPRTVGGVGKESPTISQNITLPVHIPGWGADWFSGDLIPDSNVPALMGMDTMTRWNCILDLRPGRMHMYTSDDPSDLNIQTKNNGSGIQKLQMQRTRGGHLILPCTAFENNDH